MTYKIKTDVFEGPFDLLLHLIKVNEMGIYDIRITEITEQYLEYIEQMKKRQQKVRQLIKKGLDLEQVKAEFEENEARLIESIFNEIEQGY